MMTDEVARQRHGGGTSGQKSDSKACEGNKLNSNNGVSIKESEASTHFKQ
jgi:hypothetical protein